MFNIETFREMLPVHKHALDDGLEIQADVQERISREVSRLAAALAEAKEDLAKVEARLFIDLKGSAEKVANDFVNAQVKVHRDRDVAARRFIQAKEEHDEWAGLLEAWKQRGYSLKGLGDLYAAQYFAITSVSGSPSAATDVRRQLNDMRRTTTTSPRPRRRIES